MIFQGVYTAIVTPFNMDGSVDYEAFSNLIEEQINAGVNGIVVLGTTGESPTITHKEHNEVIKFVVDSVNKRVQVIAGTGSNSTAEAVMYSKKAREDGADGLLIVNPYYNKPTQNGLYEHFKLIADEVDIPQIVYNIKGRTGVNIETDTLLRLAEHKNIVSVKEASGDINQIMSVIMRSLDDFSILSGDDNMTFPLMSLGGHGVVSVVSNVVPGQVLAMVDGALKGDWNLAREKHYELLPLMRACFLETNPIPIKTMLAMKGKIKESFRLPMCQISKENRNKLERLLDGYYI